MRTAWRYSIDGTFEEYPVPGFDKDDTIWIEVLRSAGFEEWETWGGPRTVPGSDVWRAVLGDEKMDTSLGIDIWNHPDHGFLVHIHLVAFPIVSVICPDGLHLFRFLARECAPLLQAVTVSQQIGGLAEKIRDTVLHPEHGIEPALRAAQEALRWRQLEREGDLAREREREGLDSAT